MWKLTWSNASRRAQILNSTSSVILTTDSLYSKSLIEYATKYVDIGTVTWKCDHTHSGFPFLKGEIDPSIIQRIDDIGMCMYAYTYISRVFLTGMLLKALYFFSWPKMISNFAEISERKCWFSICKFHRYTHTHLSFPVRRNRGTHDEQKSIRIVWLRSI